MKRVADSMFACGGDPNSDGRGRARADPAHRAHRGLLHQVCSRQRGQAGAQLLKTLHKGRRHQMQDNLQKFTRNQI